MHSYSKAFNFTHWVHPILLALAVGIYWLISLIPGIEALGVGPLMSLSIFAGLELFFEHFAWRLLCKASWLQVIDLGGTYHGSINPEGKASNYKVTLTVRQSWSRMQVNFDSSGTLSSSFSGSIIKNRRKPGEFELVYCYYVETKGDVPAHYGTGMLVVSNDRKQLTGQYYTEQNRNSWGELEVSLEAPSKPSDVAANNPARLADQPDTARPKVPD